MIISPSITNISFDSLLYYRLSKEEAGLNASDESQHIGKSKSNILVSRILSSYLGERTAGKKSRDVLLINPSFSSFLMWNISRERERERTYIRFELLNHTTSNEIDSARSNTK